MFIDKLKVTPYIEAPEACKLSGYRTLEDIFIAKEIYDYYIKTCSKDHNTDDAFICAIGTIWNAGRIQGIREERVKKHKKRRKICPLFVR